MHKRNISGFNSIWSAYENKLDTGLLNGDYTSYFNVGKDTKGDDHVLFLSQQVTVLRSRDSSVGIAARSGW
jgi:hypothetical protein